MGAVCAAQVLVTFNFFLPLPPFIVERPHEKGCGANRKSRGATKKTSRWQGSISGWSFIRDVFFGGPGFSI